MYTATALVVILAALTLGSTNSNSTTVNVKEMGMPSEERLRDMFVKYDKDKSNTIDKKEGEALAAAYHVDKTVADKIFDDADKNKDGLLDFDDFKAAVHSGCCTAAVEDHYD